MIKKNTKNLALVLLVIIALLLFGCSSKEDSYENEAPMEAKEEAQVGFSNSDLEDNAQSPEQAVDGRSQRKIIKNGDISLETESFDETTNGIVDLTAEVGGYIENSNITGKSVTYEGSVQNRTAHFVLRIPEERFEEVLLLFNTLGNITHISSSGEDITSKYFDNEARLKSLEIQEERLLEILKKAEKIEDIIKLEQELSDIRYKIENKTGTLKKWDNMVSYGTLAVHVHEVQVISETKEPPVTFMDEVVYNFKDSVKVVMELLKGLFIAIIYMIPFAIVVVPVALIGVYIYRKTVKTDKKKISKKEDSK